MGRFWWFPFSCGPAKVPGISAAQLNSALKDESKPVLLVDVRNEAEYNKGHIKGAVNVPLGKLDGPEIAAKVEEIAKESGCSKSDVEVVCVCLTAHRTPPAVRLIQEADPSLNVKQLDYGMANWWLKKYESVPSEQSEKAAA